MAGSWVAALFRGSAPTDNQLDIMWLVILGTLALASLGIIAFLINRRSAKLGPPTTRAELLERVRRLP